MNGLNRTAKTMKHESL